MCMTVNCGVGDVNLKLFTQLKAFQLYSLWEHLGGPEKDQILFWDCLYSSMFSLHGFFS